MGTATSPVPPAAYAAPGQTVFVERPGGSGFAVASLVLGLIGALFGLIPLFFFLSIPAGVLALIFGVVAVRRHRGGAASGKGMAIAGAILGGLALVLGIVGVVAIGDAANELDQDLQEIEQDFQRDVDQLEEDFESGLGQTAGF